MARDSEGQAGDVADYYSYSPYDSYSPRALRGRRCGGQPTARADTLVKPEASGATSPSTVRLTLLQTLKLPTDLLLNFRPPTSLYAELWGYTASLTVGCDLSLQV